jgi:hypothetical protein
MWKIMSRFKSDVMCSFVLVGFLFAGCMPNSQVSTRPPTMTNSPVTESSTKDILTLSPTPLGTSTPLIITTELQITPFPWVTSTFPEELTRIFDTDRCERPCFRGLMLGQTMDEALTAIRNDPAVDTNYRYPNDDYINVYSDEMFGLTTVEWYWKNNEDYPPPSRGFVSIQNNNNTVIDIVVDLNTAVPLNMMLDEFGESIYVLTDYHSPGEVTFYLHYSDLGVAFVVNNLGQPPALNELNVVQRIGIRELDTDMEWVCTSGVYKGLVQKWNGYGGLNVYYDDEGNLIDAIHLNCPTLDPS